MPHEAARRVAARKDARVGPRPQVSHGRARARGPVRRDVGPRAVDVGRRVAAVKEQHGRAVYERPRPALGARRVCGRRAHARDARRVRLHGEHLGRAHERERRGVDAARDVKREPERRGGDDPRGPVRLLLGGREDAVAHDEHVRLRAEEGGRGG